MHANWMKFAFTDDADHLQMQISQALINTAAMLFGVVISLLLYYNYLLLQPYWSPIVAAVLISIALHSTKNFVAQDIKLLATSKDSFYITFIKLNYNRMVGYFKALFNELKRVRNVFHSQTTTASGLRKADSTDFISTPTSRSTRLRRRRHRLAVSLDSPETLLSSQIGASPSSTSREATFGEVHRRRPGTFPFFFVVVGIVILIATHLPFIFWLASLIGLLAVFIIYFFLRLTGLSARVGQFIHSRADSIATLTVVFGLLTIVLMLSAFFTVHCALELSSAAAEFYSFVNQQFDNKDVREWFQSLGLQTEVQEAIDKIYAWSNKTSPSILKMLKAFNSTYSAEEGAARRLASQIINTSTNVTLDDVKHLMDSFGLSNFTILDFGHPVLKMGEIINAVGNAGISVVRIFFLSCFMIVSQLLNLSLQAIVFLMSLIYLLNARHNAIHYLVQILPVTTQRKFISEKLNAAIRDTLECSVQVSVTHAFLTYISFRFVGVEYVYSATLLSGILSVIPLVGSWMVSFPGGLLLWWRGSYLSAIILVLFHLLTYIAIDPWIYNVVSNIPPFITSLAIVMGYYAFDIFGVFFGPVLVLGALIVREIFAEVYYTNGRRHGHKTADGMPTLSDYDS